VAITLTTVATVLITMSIAPLMTALFARLFLHHRLPTRTWMAIAVAGAGIAWMFGRQALAGGGSLTGTLVALGVPIAGATNWTLLQHLQQRQRRDPDIEVPDMLPPVWIGAVLSALVTLPMAWPFSASAHDLGLLGLLAVVYHHPPARVQVAKVLPAPEVSLIDCWK
jgi:drug/metabolite transporter (DMT)-like permease